MRQSNPLGMTSSVWLSVDGADRDAVSRGVDDIARYRNTQHTCSREGFSSLVQTLPKSSRLHCHTSLIVSSRDHNFASPALLNRSSLFMYTCRLLTALCRVLFISSLTGTPLSLLEVT